MKPLITCTAKIIAFVFLAMLNPAVHADIASNEVAQSPWGADDEIGALNMMSATSSFEILKQIASGKVYDLGVELFVGMPSCCTQFGNPGYQIFMTHRPAQDNSQELVSYSGDAVSMYTHIGTPALP